MNKRSIMGAILMGLCLLISCTKDPLPEISLPEIKISAGIDAATRNTVAGINQTILDVNKTLKSGVNIGAETRHVIDTLIKQIEEFNRSGIIGKEGLEVAQRLITVVDKGIDVGLDEATMSMVNDLADMIDRQPEKWGEQSQLLVKLLGLVGTELANKIAGDVSKLSTQITADIGDLGLLFGAQARCTIDYSGQTINRTIEQAGGKFVAGLLPFLKKLYAAKQEPAQLPGVCTITPSEIQLIWHEGNLVAAQNSRLVKISGFNFSNQLQPKLSLQSEDGQIYQNIRLTPLRETSYQLTVNLEGKSFNEVKPGSKLVFVWSEVIPDATFVKAVLVESAPIAIANFQASTTRGDAPLSVQFFDQSSGSPTSRFWEFGDGATSQEKDPTHEYKLPGTFSVKLTVDNQFGPPNSHEEKDFVVVAAPAIEARFDGAPRRGVGSLSVTFQDRSIGNPVSWLWDFGDGTSANSREPVPHIYSKAGSYTVKLTVRNAFGNQSIHEEPAYVVVQEPTPAPTLVPELAIQTYVVAPTSVLVQGNTHATIVISNQGDGAAGAFTIEWRPLASGAFVQRTSAPGLGSGQSQTFSFDFAYPDPGAFDAVVIVDVDNSVAETNEGNNSASQRVTVQSPIPQPTFTISESPIVEAHKYGLCGDMSADYDLFIAIPSGFQWDGDVDKVKELTQVWGREIGDQGGDMRWNIEGTPWLQDAQLVVRIHVGAGCWVGGPKIFMQAKAQFVSNP